MVEQWLQENYRALVAQGARTWSQVAAMFDGEGHDEHAEWARSQDKRGPQVERAIEPAEIETATVKPKARAIK